MVAARRSPSLPDGNPSMPSKMFVAGSAACIADVITFPLDTAKVRLQIQGEKPMLTAVENGNRIAKPHYRGLLQTMTAIAKDEGPRGLYKGLNAGIQRQFCFASVRFGLYDSVKAFYQQLLYGSNVPDDIQVFTRIAAGITTGGLAVVLAQPTDVVKVRFQAHRSGNVVRYTSTMQAYKDIATNEGIKGLWKGTIPNIGRNAIINVSEIVCYDIIKEYILRKKWMSDNVPCHLVSAVTAGFCATLVASPVDVIKTRYMNSKPGEYKGATDCALRTASQEGAFAFYKGFTPSFYRLVSWNIVMWVTYEQLKRLFH